jgi:hypothetical protein
VLIAPRQTLANYFPDCGWRWNGWEFGVPVKSIEFRAGSGAWATLGGNWQLDWWDPAPTGACCLPDGSCTQLLVADCVSQNGIFRGDSSSCAGAGCAAFLPTGAPTSAISAPTSAQIHTIFMDLTAQQDLTIDQIDYTPGVPPGTATTVQIWTYPGSYIGNDASQAGWVLHDTVQSTAVNTTTPVPLVLNIPLALTAGQTVGVYLIGTPGEIRFRTGSTTSADANLTVFSDRTRTVPWSGTLGTGRVFAGRFFYSMGSTCYANCDGSTTAPILNVEDFTCFINEFAAASQLPHQQQLTHYANCDQSTTAPVLNVEDFTCFINKFAQGCP